MHLSNSDTTSVLEAGTFGFNAGSQDMSCDDVEIQCKGVEQVWVAVNVLGLDSSVFWWPVDGLLDVVWIKWALHFGHPFWFGVS